MFKFHYERLPSFCKELNTRNTTTKWVEVKENQGHNAREYGDSSKAEQQSMQIQGEESKQSGIIKNKISTGSNHENLKVKHYWNTFKADGDACKTLHSRNEKFFVATW